MHQRRQMNQSPDPPATGTREDVARFVDQSTGRVAGAPEIASLSDLGRSAAALLRERWPEIPAQERARLTREMVEDAEANVERNFNRAFLVALDDDEPRTRRAAIEGLWEYEGTDLLERLLQQFETEQEPDVRTAQIMAFGRFAMLSELGELDESQTARLKDVLLRLADDDDSIDVRRRAIESLGYFSGDDEVDSLIEEAYESGIHENRVSAIHAMGRQATTRWLDICMENLTDSEPEIRFEAVTSVGMIGEPRTVPAIIDLISDPDAEVRLAAIGALGAIGGPMATNALRRLTSEDDPAVVEAAEDALEEAQIASGPSRPLA